MREIKSFIKCRKCNTWNEDAEFCKACNASLNYEVALEQEREKRIYAFENRPPGEAAQFMAKMKSSPSFLVKGVYYILNSIWLLFAGIVTFIMAVIALAPG